MDQQAFRQSYRNGGQKNDQAYVSETHMKGENVRKDETDFSISGHSAALFFSDEPSLAQLLFTHGINVRDFILITFLADRGPLTVCQLARIIDIEPSLVLSSVKRLAAAGLVIRDPISTDPNSKSLVRVTGRGQGIATSIDEQF